MSWRRGELWLDTELSWFGQAPVAAAYVPAPVPSFGPPPGLVASRLRRAAWKRRREARRARATAIALSPAVVFALATLRSGGDSRALVDDPPSLTLRIDHRTGAVRPAPKAERVVRSRLPSPLPAHVRRRAVPVHVDEHVEWRHATSVGLPFGGSLIDGTQLPIEGLDWVTWDPVTDSSPNLPKRLYGNERTIRAILSVTRAYRAAHPNAPRVVVGDISREGGGPMTDEHVSHQNGLDVDIYYPRLDRTLRAPTAHEQIDFRLSQDLVNRFVAAGAQMIFVGFTSGLRGPAGVVIPYANHDYHMHVRFPPTGG
jgi:hypothetical protein